MRRASLALPRFGSRGVLIATALGLQVGLQLGLQLGLMTVSPSEAQAFCRSTSCTGDCPRDDDGCKTSGLKLYWGKSCVGFSLHEDASSFIPMKYFRQVAQRSFLAWTELECDTGLSTIGFSELDEVSCHKTEYNSGGTNANVILFQDTNWKYKGIDNTLAKTTVTFDDDSGEILDADIEINHANNNFTISDMVIEYDLEAVLTHEVGHFIGLDHSPDFSATMYAGYEVGTLEGRTPELDDVLAVCQVYPPERQASCDPTPRGGLGKVCGGGDEEDGGESGEGCSVVAASAPGSSGSGAGYGLWGLWGLAAWTLRKRWRKPSRLVP